MPATIASTPRPRNSPRSLRAEYQVYVEREVEDYKNSVSTAVLHSIAGDAAQQVGLGFASGRRSVRTSTFIVIFQGVITTLICFQLRHPCFQRC